MNRLALLAAFGIAAAMAGATIPATAATSDGVATLKACLTAERKLGNSGQKCIGRIADPCLADPQHGSTMSIAACHNEETTAWDSLLNDDYQGLLSILEGKEQESLRKAQRAWLASRNADCSLFDDMGGSMTIIDDSTCMLKSTAERVVQLGIWRDQMRPEEANDRMREDSGETQDDSKPSAR
jgi:uncharacterized protein YecT (DUF1311 family)